MGPGDLHHYLGILAIFERQPQGRRSRLQINPQTNMELSVRATRYSATERQLCG